MSNKIIAFQLDLARRQFDRASKDGQNPHLKNRYATLDAILEAVEPALAAHGLAWHQQIVTEPALVCRTTLQHLESGETLICEIPLLSDSGGKINPMQALGSAITYARRYGLQCLLGVLADDDDGHGSHPPVRQQEPRRPSQQHSGQPAYRPATVPPRPNSPAASAEPAEYTPFEDAPNRPDRPWRAWLLGESNRLGLSPQGLVDALHDAAVTQDKMQRVDPKNADNALNRRYESPTDGRLWRQWMTGVCQQIEARIDTL